jgi:hypothetical protein
MSAADVITVPDFSGPAVPGFELRALLFLGAWIRHHGASRSWPLHLACIGEPPASVRRLAGMAGASVTVHPPMPAPFPETANKLRGLEIAPSSDRFLLLDTDTVVLKDLAPMARAVGDGIGVGPATFNHLPEPLWRRIYELVGVPYPGPTGTCWHAQWDLSAHRPISPPALEQCLRMPPYYNSGVVMAPWSLHLGRLWKEHIERIVRGLDSAPVPAGTKWVRHSDQHGLATATEALRREGARVVTLPLPYQARPPLLHAGVLQWPEVALFHYVKVFRPYGETVAGVRDLLYGRRLSRLRRMVAGALGLRAIRSPAHRRMEERHLRVYNGFLGHVHRVFAQFRL